MSYGLIWFPRANLEPAHLDLESALNPSWFLLLLLEFHTFARGEEQKQIFMRALERAGVSEPDRDALVQCSDCYARSILAETEVWVAESAGHDAC